MFRRDEMVTTMATIMAAIATVPADTRSCRHYQRTGNDRSTIPRTYARSIDEEVMRHVNGLEVKTWHVAQGYL